VSSHREGERDLTKSGVTILQIRSIFSQGVLLGGHTGNHGGIEKNLRLGVKKGGQKQVT